ncbi:MAG: HAMP domain-containing histidine kinase [Dehalococcoidales bacterium]|nr:MAG: HAMP domain-containing histidine kinase [Dehalococcoidales bacterium]
MQMNGIQIQTDIFSLVFTVLGAFILGGIIIWLVLRRRNQPDQLKETVKDDTPYMLLSRLAHRLKTAGEVIRGHLHPFTEQLPKDEERWRVAYKAILEESSGINYLTDRMDLVVRLGLTGQPLVFEPVHVPRLLEDLMLNLAPAAEEKGITLGSKINSQSDTVSHITADVSALREVFSNLLGNAVQHNGAGTEITAEVSQLEKHLLVCIKDTGKGMPEETISGIFEKGSSSYRPQRTSGTGMGLYFCKMLIELHGGRIEARSSEGEGTQFNILLPLRRVI